jgi:broad specificity phosphatase PhoE
MFRRRAMVMLLMAVGAPALGLAAPPAPAAANEALWALLRGGRQVVLMRHAITTTGVGDPPGFKLDDCATQRNLSDAGRADARRVGEAFRTRGAPVGRVLTSPWCRCQETAQLAFGQGEISTPLSNLYGRSEKSVGQVRELEALIASWRPEGAGGNLLLVSHGSTILALTGVSLAPAEIVVVTPRPGERFSVAGRMLPR